VLVSCPTDAVADLSAVVVRSRAMNDRPLMRQAFPADQPLSRFLVSMAMARNDIEQAMWKAAEASEADLTEFGYWVRLVMGSLRGGFRRPAAMAQRMRAGT
jgi:hypothetical protein